MTTLYQQFVPVLIKYLRNLSQLVKKGETFCQEKGIKNEDLINYRLISDMRGLTYQVQSCSNTVKLAVQRLGAPDIPVFEDTETTFEELQARIQRTVELLEGVDPAVVNDNEDADLIMETKIGDFKFKKQRYISEFVLPNFYFHLSTAYCLLRTQGVPIDAVDYLKDVFVKA